MNQIPSIYALKPRFQDVLRPCVNRLAQLGITPNQVTLAACVLSIATGLLTAQKKGGRMLLALPAVLIVRMALNALDGMLAREHHQKTRLGALLNELGDAVSDASLYLPLALVTGFTPWLVVTIVLLAILTEMTGVMGAMIGASRRCDGPCGKSDRAFFFGALGLLLGGGARIEPAVPFLLYGLILLLVCTVINRARGALQEAALNGGAR